MRLALLAITALLAAACSDSSSNGNDLSAGALDFSAPVEDDMAAPGDMRAGGGWKQVWPPNDPGGPQPRVGFAIAWDGSRLLFSAGQVKQGPALNDLWSFDPATKMWTQITADGAAGSPPARLQHAVLWTGTKLLLFGGEDGSAQNLNDVWSWTSASGWTQELANGVSSFYPGALFATSTTWTGNSILIYQSDGSLWAYDPIAKQWSQAIASSSAPGARNQAAIASTGTATGSISDGGVTSGVDVILFGGYTGIIGSGMSYKAPNDVWATIASGGWTMKIFSGATGSPSGRFNPTLFWDGSEYLMFGGDEVTDPTLSFPLGVDDLWSYSPATNRWTLIDKGRGTPWVSDDTRWPTRVVGTANLLLAPLADSSVWEFTR